MSRKEIFLGCWPTACELIGTEIRLPFIVHGKRLLKACWDTWQTGGATRGLEKGRISNGAHKKTANQAAAPLTF